MKELQIKINNYSQIAMLMDSLKKHEIDVLYPDYAIADLCAQSFSGYEKTANYPADQQFELIQPRTSDGFSIMHAPAPNEGWAFGCVTVGAPPDVADTEVRMVEPEQLDINLAWLKEA